MNEKVIFKCDKEWIENLLENVFKKVISLNCLLSK